MLSQIRNAIHRSEKTLFADAIGAVSLVALLLFALHLPAFA
ncbi:hypothetical protein [Puniceibacterium sp. IMCC21224]|nr:hypothetical protein [Puniceibacterium sp. IMCC21224]KMK67375.1 hypothetical protein IMCC21224_112243 [Puniceibacterium sp. IMCC21224]